MAAAPSMTPAMSGMAPALNSSGTGQSYGVKWGMAVGVAVEAVELARVVEDDEAASDVAIGDEVAVKDVVSDVDVADDIDVDVDVENSVDVASDVAVVDVLPDMAAVARD